MHGWKEVGSGSVVGRCYVWSTKSHGNRKEGPKIGKEKGLFVCVVEIRRLSGSFWR